MAMVVYRTPTLDDLRNAVETDLATGLAGYKVKLFTGSPPSADSAVSGDFTLTPGTAEVVVAVPNWNTGIDSDGNPATWASAVAFFTVGADNPGNVANGWIAYQGDVGAAVILCDFFDTPIDMSHAGDSLSVVVRWAIPPTAVVLPNDVV